jgi:hypothetical protein
MKGGIPFIETVIYAMEVIIMLSSPFWTLFQGFSLVQNNYDDILVTSKFAPPMLFKEY